MEQKSWLWKKKNSEKFTSKKSAVLKEKAIELERSLEDLNEQLSSVRTESNAKDNLLEKQAKVAEEAIAGWEKAESEALSFKQQLDDAAVQKEEAEERIVNLDTALKECMQQLRVVKEDQQIIIDNATTKISREQEKVRKLEESLVETNRRLTELVIQHSNLGRTLDLKEQLIKDLSESKLKLEASIAEVNSRLESSEKSNTSLKYEVCMLEKELQIRNEEKDFNLRSADAAHRQQLESVKKIAKLESECQRLRVMVRKRLPGPAALAKMRSEVEILGGDSTELRKKRSNFTFEPSKCRDLVSEDHYLLSNKSASSFGDRLRVIEEENKILRESLLKKSSEFQSLHAMFAQTASKLSQVESQLEEVSKGQGSYELSRSSPLPFDLTLSSISEHGGNEDNISCTGSWASALMSELEHFTGGKKVSPSCMSTGASDLSLMDDFVEMEKLAIISVDTNIESSIVTSADGKLCVLAAKEARAAADLSEATGKELVLVESLSNVGEEKSESQISYESYVKCPSWLQDILRVIIQKNHMTKRSFHDILEQVRAALKLEKQSDEVLCTSKVLGLSREISPNLFDGTISTGILNTEGIGRIQSNMEKQIIKLIELVEGIIQKNIQTKKLQQLESDEDRGNNCPSVNDYVSRAFLWDSSELVSVLQHFLTVCNDLLCGKANLEKFTAEIASTLDWVMNHCFSLQDVSDMKESIKKNLDSEDLNGHNDLKVVIYPASEIDQLSTYEKINDAKEASGPSSSSLNGALVSSRMDRASKVKDEIDQLKSEIMHMESRKKDLEKKLKTASDKNEALISELQKSEENISSLQEEVETLKDSKGLIEDQIENQKLINEDLGSQLHVAKAELDVARHNFSLLEVQLEDRSNFCEELEATCLELQLQLESASCEESSKIVSTEEKNLRTENEIAAASEKLAACQETILNLGKQLKALASPTDAQLFDKVLSPASVNPNHQCQLLEQMKSDDGVTPEELKFPKTKDIECAEKSCPADASDNPSMGLFYGQTVKKNPYPENALINIMLQAPAESPVRVKSNSSNYLQAGANGGRLMIVPTKQKGRVSLLRKLLLRNKDNNNKFTLPVGS